MYPAVQDDEALAVVKPCAGGECRLRIEDGFSSPEEKYRNGPMTLMAEPDAEILENRGNLYTNGISYIVSLPID